MIGRATFERGSRFTRDVAFNDVSTLPTALPSTLPSAHDSSSPGDDAVIGPELELSWGEEQVLPTRVLTFVHETDPLLRLGVWADPALFTREQAEGFLVGLVRLLEAAAAGDVALDALTEVTGVRPVERGADWERVEGSWVSPPAVAEALSRALDGVPVHVTTDPPHTGGPAEADAGRGLTAYIASGGAP